MCACVYCDVNAHMVCGMVLVWRHREGGRGRLGHTLLLGVLQDQPSVSASSLSLHYMEVQEFHFPLFLAFWLPPHWISSVGNCTLTCCR